MKKLRIVFIVMSLSMVAMERKDITKSNGDIKFVLKNQQSPCQKSSLISESIAICPYNSFIDAKIINAVIQNMLDQSEKNKK